MKTITVPLMVTMEVQDDAEYVQVDSNGRITAFDGYRWLSPYMVQAWRVPITPPEPTQLDRIEAMLLKLAGPLLIVICVFGCTSTTFTPMIEEPVTKRDTCIDGYEYTIYDSGFMVSVETDSVPCGGAYDTIPTTPIPE